MTSGNEQIGYNMDPAYQVGYTQQEVDGKSLKLFVFFPIWCEYLHVCKLGDLHFVFDTGHGIGI